MDLQFDYTKRFAELSKSTNKLSGLLDQFIKADSSSSHEMASQLPPRECAELHVSLGIALISLYKAQLRCQGTDESKHSIAQENDRLASYLAKLRYSDDVKTRKISLDVVAAERFVTSHLTGNADH